MTYQHAITAPPGVGVSANSEGIILAFEASNHSQPLKKEN